MRIVLILAALALAACSPEQNWREVGFDGLSLRVQLPCQPDRTSREVPLGGAPVQLVVAGCESGDALLATMTAALPAGADVQAALQGWQKLTLEHLQVDVPQSQPWVQVGMLPMAAAQQIQATGRRADGQPVAVQAVWGAWSEQDHVRLVHAVVYAPQPRAELARHLFDSIRP